MTKAKSFFANHKGIIWTVALVVISFVVMFGFMIPVRFNNMGGTHSWLSGSTIKFVNYWLEDGMRNLKFTNYESPASIEFNDLEDRTPYLSYPTGETFFVYSAAKVLGKKQISIGFLHKFQLAMFGIEAVLLASFLYYFLTRTVKYKSEFGKIVISVLSALLWVLLPTCNYYLVNIYYADQCVILWVMAILLCEYLFRTSTEKKNTFLKSLRAFLIFTGLLIDYYFWILVFFLFLAEIIGVFANRKKGKRKKEIINILLWFAIPVILAVTVFFIQLIQTNDWFNIMTGKFTMRVVGREEDTFDWEMTAIFENFARAFSLDARTIFYLIILLLATLIGIIGILIKRKKLKILVKNPGVSIIIANILAIIVQIYFLKQHSAIHEFSMIKVGWAIALLPMIMALTIGYVFKINLKTRTLLIIFLPCLLAVNMAIGIPISTEEFTNERMWIGKYDFEEMVRDNTGFQDVLFSFSKEIEMNPPQSLAISEKRIYKINNVKGIEEKFPELSSEAKKVLVVDKTDKELDKEKLKQQKCLMDGGEIRIETGSFYLVDLGNINNCIKEKK